MNILSLLFFITIIRTGTDSQQSKLAEARQIATIDIVKDSLDSWIPNWGLSCSVPERIIESGKQYFAELPEDCTYLLEYALSGEEDNDEPLYKNER